MPYGGGHDASSEADSTCSLRNTFCHCEERSNLNCLHSTMWEVHKHFVNFIHDPVNSKLGLARSLDCFTKEVRNTLRARCDRLLLTPFSSPLPPSLRLVPHFPLTPFSSPS